MSADAVVAEGLTLPGRCYSADPDAFAALLFPGVPLSVARPMAQADSCCALAVMSALRQARCVGLCTIGGRRLDALRTPYTHLQGLAISILIEIGVESGLWKKSPGLDDLQPGTVVLLEAPDHALIITGRTEVDGVVHISSTDGGQPDKPPGGSGSAILAKVRIAVMHGAQLVLGRPVRGCFPAGELACIPDAALDPDATGPHDALP